MSDSKTIHHNLCVSDSTALTGDSVSPCLVVLPVHLADLHVTSLHAPVFLSVPPQRVTISGGTGPLRSGDNVQLTCVSSNSNPRSTITWFARGRQIPDSDVTNTYQVSPLGGFVTRSTVSVTLSHQEHNVIYTCQATNDVGQTVADTVTLSVLCKLV